jgi:hypothetical protein
MSHERVNRARHYDLGEVLDRVVDSSGGGAPAVLLTTTTVNKYPTFAVSYFACNPTELGGDEVEGGTAPSSVDNQRVVFALNVGRRIPPSGTPVVAHAVGARWVFRFDG